MVFSGRGAFFPTDGDIGNGILAFIKQALGKSCYDAVLVPTKMPRGDLFAYSLIRDESLLEYAYPFCPIMPVQGPKAVSKLTKHWKGRKRIAALMRPCELRATIELSKLTQTNLENMILISVDCPGVLPLSEWAKDPRQAETAFSELLKGRDSKGVRPICQICDKFSATGGEDLHIGTTGIKDSLLLIPRSPQGKSILDKLGLQFEQDISDWQNSVDALTDDRKKKREQAQKELESRATGLDNLLNTFSRCINCHNCMRVCPICYCLHCFFDSDNLRFTFEDYLWRAEVTGGLRLPPETLLFHIGRMLHMSISCVSCGTCEDACPVSIPVAQVFSLVGNRNQEAFDYVPGRSLNEPLPLRVYEEKEFEEVEQSYVGTSAKQEAHDV